MTYENVNAIRAWGIFRPYIIPTELESRDVAAAVRSAGDWSPVNWVRHSIWELVEVPVHIHGTIDRVSGATLNVTLDDPAAGKPTTAELTVDSSAVIAAAKVNEGREFCIRGLLESLDGNEIDLNSVPSLVPYQVVNSISAIKGLPTGVIATVTGRMESISVADGRVRCVLSSEDGSGQHLIAIMHEDEDVQHLKQGRPVTLQGRYTETVGPAFLNGARRLSKSGDKRYHATEVHDD